MERISEYQDERWKERARQIRELDGHKCALCGATGLLHVHHLSYPPAPYHLWDSTDNELVTLCPDCHRKVHESPTRPYLDEYRNLEGLTDDDKLAEESWEYEMECEREYETAKHSNENICANCAFGEFKRPDLNCRFRILEDRDFWDTDPHSSCERYARRACFSCKHYHPDEIPTGEGNCDVYEKEYGEGEGRIYGIDTERESVCNCEHWELNTNYKIN